MIEFLKKFLSKAPKGVIGIPVALVAVVLITIMAIPNVDNNKVPDDDRTPIVSDTEDDADDTDVDLDHDASADNEATEGESDKTGNEGTDDSQDQNGDADDNDADDSSSEDSSADNNQGSADAGTSGSTGNSNGSGSTGGSGNTGNTGNSGNTGGSGNTGDSGNTGGSGNSGSTASSDLNVPGISLSEIPAYSNSYYIALNNNTPHFATTGISTNAYEYYSPLDSLGRCGVAYACLGPELLPTEARGDISSVHPSGWIQAQYSCVPGNALWNRSHLIAFSLAGENANEKNLITGTQHMNQIEMQVYERQVLDYIRETGNHVLYRVTPMFEGNNLVATGVQMEGWSIEDNGETICFNVFLYNVQDGVIIDYATGRSSLDENADNGSDNEAAEGAQYVVHKSKGTLHKISCGSLPAEHNRIYCETLDEAVAESQKITGGAPKYAGCCMKGYSGENDNGCIDFCCEHHHENVISFTHRHVRFVAAEIKHVLLAA